MALHTRSRLLEALEDIGENRREDLLDRWLDRKPLRTGTAIITAKEDGAAQDRLLQQAAQPILHVALAAALLSNQSYFLSSAGAALFTAQHLLRAVNLGHGAVERLIEAGDPE